MSKLTVEQVPAGRGLPVFSEFEEIAERIRDRAFVLSAERDFRGGHDLDDWLTAERELCWPAAELVEDDDEYEIKVALAGYKPGEISVTATPEHIIVKADHESDELDEDEIRHFSEFRDNRVYRRFGFPRGVRLGNVKAKYKNGLLKIEAEKLAEPVSRPREAELASNA